MDIISLVLTVFGLAISGAAYWKADDAKKAVQKALKKRNADEDLKRLRDLIVVMETAKEAVTPWVSGMPHDRRTGRDQPDDLAKLSTAIDCLRTRAPLDLENAIQRRTKKSATVLDKEFNEITNPTDNKDHWKAALSEIQLMIPRLEQLERSMRDAQIIT
ncbi:MAG: hypothetical protein ACSHWZ_12865 [Sulfitobacter sp.]